MNILKCSFVVAVFLLWAMSIGFTCIELVAQPRSPVEQRKRDFEGDKQTISALQRESEAQIMIRNYLSALFVLTVVGGAAVVYAIFLTYKRSKQFQAEEQMRQSHENLNTILETVSVGIVVLRRGSLAFVNTTICRILGYTKEQLLNGLNPFELVHPDDRDEVIQRHQARLLGEPVPASHQVRFLHNNSSIVWIEFSGVLILYQSEPCVLAVFADITQRKSAEQKLREHELQVTALMENTEDAICLLDQYYRLQIMNKAFQRGIKRFYGIEVAIGMNVLEALPTPVRREWRQFYDRALLGTRFNIEYVQQAADKKSCFLEVSFNPIVDAGQYVVGAAIFTRNITLRKQMEKELRERELQLSSLINNTQDAIWSVDTAYCLIAFNAAFRIAMRQQGIEVYAGMNLLEDSLSRYKNYNRSLWQGSYDSVLQNRKGFRIEFASTVLNRQIFNELSLSPILDYQGNVCGIAASSRDITERKVATQHLEVTLAEKEQLLAALEHEKNASLRAFLEGQENERHRIAKDLHDGVGHLLSVVKIGLSGVQDTLEQTAHRAYHHTPRSSNGHNRNGAFAAPENNYAQESTDERAELSTIITLLDQAVHEVRSVSHQLMPATLMKLGLQAALKDLIATVTLSTRLKTEAELDDIAERFDVQTETSIYHIVQELVNNTLKHAQATKLSIQLTRHPQSLTLMVEDDGCGFDMDALPYGAGLSNICNRVTLLGGTVDIHSSLGGGMVATIDIPVRAV